MHVVERKKGRLCCCAKQSDNRLKILGTKSQKLISTTSCNTMRVLYVQSNV